MRAPEIYPGPVIPYVPDAPDANARFGRWPKRWLKLSARFAETIDVTTKHGPMRGLRSDITVMGKYLRTGQWHGHLDRVMAKVAEIAGPGALDLLVNVGANNGSTIIPMLKHGFAARAIAVEPEPANAALVRENLRRNGLERHVTLLELAVGAAPGRLALEVSPSNKGDHRLAPSNGGMLEAGWHRIEVAVAPLDTALAGVFDDADPKRTLTWMDIQGAEHLALAGGADFFARAPLLFAEFDPRAMERLGAKRDETVALFGAHWNRMAIGELGWILEEAPIADLGALWDRCHARDRETDLLLWRV